jgi:hypothetical protein
MKLAKINPENPPNVNENKKPKINRTEVVNQKQPDQIVLTQFNILIPVGIAITEVAVVK